MSRPPRGTPGESLNGQEAKSQFARHERWLRTVILARTGNRDVVEEVLQEVAVAYIRSETRPNKRENLEPWLYRVAVRQSLLSRRNSGRRQRLTRQFAETHQPTEFDHREIDPLEWLLAVERQEMIRDGLQRLLPKDREILLLKYTENWSYRELAEHLGISLAAVESRLHRARERMRAELARKQILEVP